MNKLNIIGIIVLVAAFLVTQSAFIVPETKQALVLQFGDPKAQYTEAGLKFKIPFIQNVRFFESRILDVDPAPEELILADQKRLVVDTFSRYKIDDMLLFYQKLGTEEQAVSRLKNQITSSLRSVLGNVSLLDILSIKRVEIMNDISKQVNEEAHRLGIEVVDVRIVRADLPPETSQSIYARMRSEREREAAEFRAQGQEMAQEIRSKADKERTILLAEAEKEAQMLRGQGDEQAIRIYAEAFSKDPEFYSFYRTMEAYRESLSDKDTTLVLSPEGDFFRFFEDRQGKRNR